MLKLSDCFSSRSAILIALSVSGLEGCASERTQVSEQSSAPPDERLVVTTSNGTRYDRSSGMQVSVREGQLVSVAIGASAADGTNWTANFYLNPSDIPGSTVQLARKPPEAGIGYVTIRKPDDNATLIAESVAGQLIFKLHEGGMVDGEASTEPPEASATFQGKYNLSCWVFPESIGQAQNGSGNGTTLVEDAAMSSEFCQQFKGL